MCDAIGRFSLCLRQSEWPFAPMYDCDAIGRFSLCLRQNEWPFAPVDDCDAIGRFSLFLRQSEWPFAPMCDCDAIGRFSLCLRQSEWPFAPMYDCGVGFRCACGRANGPLRPCGMVTQWAGSRLFHRFEQKINTWHQGAGASDLGRHLWDLNPRGETPSA